MEDGGVGEESIDSSSHGALGYNDKATTGRITERELDKSWMATWLISEAGRELVEPC